MATNATEAKSLWLPGFGPDDDTHFPDLFNEPAPAVVELPAQEPAAAVSQPEAAPARRWKPSLVRTAANADRAITWPAWNDDVLAALSGPV